MKKHEVEVDYELNTGKLIVKEFEDKDPDAIPAVLISGHGPFSWGKDPDNAVHIAVVLEELAKMGFRAVQLGVKGRIDQFLLDKHYLRKHGKNAYYGQK